MIGPLGRLGAGCYSWAALSSNDSKTLCKLPQLSATLVAMRPHSSERTIYKQSYTLLLPFVWIFLSALASSFDRGREEGVGIRYDSDLQRGANISFSYLKFLPHFCQAKWPAHVQPIGPDRTCITELSSINFARPCSA